MLWGVEVLVTSALDEAEWTASHTGHFSFGGRAVTGWVSEPIWMLWTAEKSFVLAGN
jgi:hypothetical protein